MQRFVTVEKCREKPPDTARYSLLQPLPRPTNIEPVTVDRRPSTSSELYRKEDCPSTEFYGQEHWSHLVISLVIHGRNLGNIFGRNLDHIFGRNLHHIFARNLSHIWGRNLCHILGRLFGPLLPISYARLSPKIAEPPVTVSHRSIIF